MRVKKKKGRQPKSGMEDKIQQALTKRMEDQGRLVLETDEMFNESFQMENNSLFLDQSNYTYLSENTQNDGNDKDPASSKKENDIAIEDIHIQADLEDEEKRNQHSKRSTQSFVDSATNASSRTEKQLLDELDSKQKVVVPDKQKPVMKDTGTIHVEEKSNSRANSPTKADAANKSVISEAKDQFEGPDESEPLVEAEVTVEVKDIHNKIEEVIPKSEVSEIKIKSQTLLVEKEKVIEDHLEHGQPAISPRAKQLDRKDFHSMKTIMEDDEPGVKFDDEENEDENNQDLVEGNEAEEEDAQPKQVPETAEIETADDSEKSAGSTMLYVGAAIGVAAIAGAVYFFTRPKK